ncbi:protein lin-52 homolog [Oratosquilla oratoria]|uniref:protein lin-52 homolog n=1 Tax=Oratosquilla oratoria TaxID=337810 RepID=UPI003F758205
MASPEGGKFQPQADSRDTTESSGPPADLRRCSEEGSCHEVDSLEVSLAYELNGKRLMSLEKMDRTSPDLWPEQNNEHCLLSLEKLDRTSPDLWPEQIPGVYEFAPLSSPQMSPSMEVAPDLEDQNLLYQLSYRTPLEIIDEVKRLQNIAYQLGLEEAKEMTRGKYLHILNNNRKIEN